MILPPTRTAASGARGGFSLAELLAVVVVIGLIAGIVSISFVSTLPRAELNSTVHDIAAAVKGAHSDSIARNAEFRIYYDIDANSYEIRSPFQLGGGLAMREEDRQLIRRVPLPESVTIARVTIDGVEYEEGRVFVAFSPLGSATGHTINLMQPLTEAVTTIEVLPLTGLVRFHYSDFQREIALEDDFQ